MKKSTLLACLVAMSFGFSSMPAWANATLSYKSAGSNTHQGIPTYPYCLSVNGGPLQALMCLGDNEHMSRGETWMATIPSVSSLDLKMARIDGGGNSDVNAALWYLFEGVLSLHAGAAALVAQAQAQTFYQGEFPGVFLYTATPGTETGIIGTAQNFFGASEPGSLMLLGTAVVGIAVAVRRKRQS